MHADPQSSARMLVRASRLAAVWTLGYALYRAYYALGGTLGILGTPVSLEQWRWINGVASVLLLVTAILPVALVRAWGSRRARPVLLALCWVIAVACASHALIGIVQRIASLTGALTIPYPFWQSIDRRRADLQALVFNEPWFLVEGLLWGAIAWNGALRLSPRRSWWVVSALAAIGASTLLGVLSAFGVIGRVIVEPVESRVQRATDTSTVDSGAPASADSDVASALAVLRDYYASLDARDYHAAFDAWNGDGPPGHPTPAAFAARYATTDSLRLALGTPSRVEGAAGSRYLSVPVTVRIFERGARAITDTGTYILRRSVVPGASTASQRWHLYRTTLRSRVEARSAP